MLLQGLALLWWERHQAAFAVIATWFVRKRTSALRRATFGGGAASVVFVPLATWMVGHMAGGRHY